MTTLNLTKQAQKVVDSYLKLPFKDRRIKCPYINNRRLKVRAGLRVLIGKGSAKDIVDEANIMALREKIEIKDMNDEELTKFLVDHNLGIDCSGFAYYVLDAELKAKKQPSLKSRLEFPHIKNPIRKLIAKLRTIENVHVKTLAHEKNSMLVELSDVKPGDMIISLGYGPKKDRSHIMIVDEVEMDNGSPKTIHYIHSFSWSTEGKYNHGVRKGKIEIINPAKNILEQNWIENDKNGEQNETHKRMSGSETVELKRIK